MSKKDLLQIPEFPELSEPYYDISPDTIGFEVVNEDIQRLRLSLFADEVRDGLRWSAERDYMIDPRVLGVGKSALIRLGIANPPSGVMTHSEINKKAYIDSNFSDETVHEAEYKASVLDSRVRQGLEKARTQLKQLEASKVGAEYINSVVYRSMSGFQKMHFDKQKEDDPLLTPINWLIEKRSALLKDDSELGSEEKDKLDQEDDLRLLNFFQWHNHRISQRQGSREFKQKVETHAKKWKNRVMRGVADGWLHEAAALRLQKVDVDKIYEGDYFSTLLHDIEGYAYPGSRKQRYIVIAASLVDDPLLVHHELNHDVLQHYPRKRPNIFGEPWLYEAATEEIALAFNGVPLGTSSLDSYAYRGSRTLLRSVTEFAQAYGVDIGISDFTVGYSSNERSQKSTIRSINQKMFTAGYPTKYFLEEVELQFAREEQRLGADNSGSVSFDEVAMQTAKVFQDRREKLLKDLQHTA